jgi:hypothetical protein
MITTILFVFMFALIWHDQPACPAVIEAAPAKTGRHINTLRSKETTHERSNSLER